VTTITKGYSDVGDYYNDCALSIKDDAKAMGWSSRFNQRLRFDVFNYLVDFTGLSVLDVGCGDGAFFHYLMDQGMDGYYKGVDISKHMVQRAHARYPGINVRQVDFFDVQDSCDVVVCSGGLSMCSGDSMHYLSVAIDHLFSISSSHLVFNLLSDHAPSTSDKFNRYHPASVLDLCFKKTPYVTLHHGYLPNDFTLHMVKS